MSAVRDDALSSPAKWRDWAALHDNALCAILSRVQTDILRGAGAGLVCKSWRRVVVEENLLWRRIDLSAAEDDDNEGPAGWQSMARAAVDRSAGRCESFRGRVDAEFLVYLADRAPLLESLHVTTWFYMEDEKFTAVIKKLPLLEQFVLSSGLFGKEGLGALLENCLRLQLIDAGGCKTMSAIGIRFVERCKRTIKKLQMPQKTRGCHCCAVRAQKYADEHHF